MMLNIYELISFSKNINKQMNYATFIISKTMKGKEVWCLMNKYLIC